MDINIIPMNESDKTDSQLVEELSAKNREMRRLLNSANMLLRSAHSIAEREGKTTFWWAFKGRIEKELKAQADFFNKG